MANYIRIVQGLLRRETLDWDYAGQRRAIRFLTCIPHIVVRVCGAAFVKTYHLATLAL